MEIKTLEFAGLQAALKALRLPHGKECRSSCIFKQDITSYPEGDFSSLSKTSSETWIYGNDMKLMETLINRGDEHAKVIRGVCVWLEIEAPIYWWCELETYKAGHERLSSESTMHVDCKGLTGENLVEAKRNIPMGKELTKIDMFSYQSLRNICRQRAGHRLPEWKQFIDFVKELPYANELIFAGLEI